MANHPYNVGDEVLIRGRVLRFNGLSQPVINPLSGGYAFTVAPESVTQSTPAEPPNKSVLLDRYGYSWQRVNGMWSQGDVNHEWAYLLEHNGPVEVIHRPMDNRGGTDG